MKEIGLKREIDFVKMLFKKYIGLNGFICGGFARFVCSPHEHPYKADDLDIYCYSESNYKNIKYLLENDGFEIKRESEIANSFKTLFSGMYSIQLIKPMKEGHILTVGSISEIINNFDFTIVRCGLYLDAHDNVKAICDDDFEEDEKNKKLRIKNIHCPIAEIFRVSKYIKKGYDLPVIETIKILNDWLTRSSEYRNNLYEKLSKESPSKEEIEQLEALLHID